MLRLNRGTPTNPEQISSKPTIFKTGTSKSVSMSPNPKSSTARQAITRIATSKTQTSISAGWCWQSSATFWTKNWKCQRSWNLFATTSQKQPSRVAYCTISAGTLARNRGTISKMSCRPKKAWFLLVFSFWCSVSSWSTFPKTWTTGGKKPELRRGKRWRTLRDLVVPRSSLRNTKKRRRNTPRRKLASYWGPMNTRRTWNLESKVS